ncbi:hypothetical protein KAU11_04905 [Candidatus Babeliales bacterium]|nr:hypothetical protein [Candidatus Babeliales bacterium]
MANQPCNQAKKAFGYWFILLLITGCISLIAARKRPRLQKRIATANLEVKSAPIAAETTTATKSIAIESEKPESEPAKPIPPPKPWDITDLEQIKILLKHNDQEKFRKGVDAFVAFLKKGDEVPSRLAKLPENEYDKIYDAISDAHSRVSWSWKTKKNWKSIYKLTAWAYVRFPYKEGWLAGNKDHIEEMHVKTCENLKSAGPEYAFEQNNNRPKWLDLGKDEQNIYNWPTKIVSYNKPFDVGSYEKMKERLEKFENLLEKAKDSLNITIYLKVVEYLKFDFDAMKHVLKDVDNAQRKKTEKRFFKTLDASTTTRDGVKSALKISKLGHGLQQTKAYVAARKLYQYVKEYFSSEYKTKTGDLIKNIEEALTEYGTD